MNFLKKSLKFIVHMYWEIIKLLSCVTFISFSLPLNQKKEVKVRHKIGMFGINFCNHTFALQEHQDFGKLIICEGVEFKFLKKLSPM